VNPAPIELLATVLFGLAVLHTFCVKRFAHWAHQYPPGSVKENFLHFLAETEVVFGLWAAALFAGIAALKGSIHDAVVYIEGLNFTEPKFVLVIMVVAATRPVVTLAEKFISLVARLIPAREGLAFYIAALIFGPLLGSFITEPAAMTLLALMLKRRYFDRGISRKLAYATLGLLFVNVSIGGTLTHFAAPPVLMVAAQWNWNMAFMFEHFGWRAACACAVSTAMVAGIFWKELSGLEVEQAKGRRIPAWLTAAHLVLLALVVGFAHYPDVFFGILMLFLGLVTATREHQDDLTLREGLLVGFFTHWSGHARFLGGLLAKTTAREPRRQCAVFWRDGPDRDYRQRRAHLSRLAGGRPFGRTEIRARRRRGDGRWLDGDCQRAQSGGYRDSSGRESARGRRHQPTRTVARGIAADDGGDCVLLAAALSHDRSGRKFEGLRRGFAGSFTYWRTAGRVRLK